jgi:ribosomal protein S18 acetylase RimI-like enzyme
MDLRIEKIVPADIPSVIELMREFAAYENLSEFCEITDERLYAALFGEKCVAEGLCSFDRDTSIGYALFYPNFASFRGQLGLYLEDIYIKQEYRAKGVGEQMLREIARIAADRGYERIDFMVLDWNTPAVKFYEKLGGTRDPDERHYKFTDDAFRSLLD